MKTMEIRVRRISVVSSRPFEDVVSRLTATIGHPDMDAYHGEIVAAQTSTGLEAVVKAAIGSAGLMEFIRFDAGAVVGKYQGGAVPGMLRLVVGNPLIMAEMARTIPDAAAHAPVTILIDERSDGVHLSYDLMESLLSPYRSPKALAVARELDEKIINLLTKVAQATVG
jgi:hypothetical protein